jgi:WD40 repeat protein
MILSDAASGRPLAPLLGHSDVVTDIAFSGDGRRALSASYDRICLNIPSVLPIKPADKNRRSSRQ